MINPTDEFTYSFRNRYTYKKFGYVALKILSMSQIKVFIRLINHNNIILKQKIYFSLIWSK